MESAEPNSRPGSVPPSYARDTMISRRQMIARVSIRLDGAMVHHVVPDTRHRVGGHCPWQLTPVACLLCWRLREPSHRVSATTSSDESARIVHFPGGSVSEPSSSPDL
jgi:phenylalanine-4-hydroxylase